MSDMRITLEGYPETITDLEQLIAEAYRTGATKLQEETVIVFTNK